MTLHVNSTHLDFLAATPPPPPGEDKSNDGDGDGDHGDQGMRNFLEDDEFGGEGDYSSIWELVRLRQMDRVMNLSRVTHHSSVIIELDTTWLF